MEILCKGTKIIRNITDLEHFSVQKGACMEKSSNFAPALSESPMHSTPLRTD